MVSGLRMRTAMATAWMLALGLSMAGAAGAAGPSAEPGAAELTVTELELVGIAAPELTQLPDSPPAPAEATTQLRTLQGRTTTPDVLTAELETAPFSVVGVTWDTAPDLTGVVIRYRVHQEGEWSDWQAAAESDVAPDADRPEGQAGVTRSGTDAIVAVDADGIQVWADAATGTVTGLKAVLIDPGEDPPGLMGGVGSSVSTNATGAVISSTSAVASSGLAAAPATAPPIIRRAEWGADESLRTCEPDLAGSTLAAAVHHTASTNSYAAGDVPGLLRGFLAYHTRPEAAGGRGWCDIGYNFLVDKFGRIFEGRAGSIESAVVGVHTGGFNSRTLGVAAIGEYGAVAPTAGLLEGISQVIAWKFATHRILANTNVTMVSGGGASKYPEGTWVTFSTIYGHRDAQLTSCPGQNLYNALPSIRNRVAALSNAAVQASPTGNGEVYRATRSEITVSGWVFDPDTTEPIDVTLTVDGVPHRTTADRDRPDLAAYFPQAGTRHGFATSVPVGGGSHATCLTAHNVGAGNDLLMGCSRLTVSDSAPIGSVEVVSATATHITATGWALDPDTDASIQVHVYVDGAAVLGTVAADTRTDVGATYGRGDQHGFSVTIPASPGGHTVCVYAIDADGGATNPQLGCRSVAVTSRAPVGSLESVTAVGSSIVVAGWALDPDTSSPIQVHVYVDGSAVRGLFADGSRPDVGQSYGVGDTHGFSTTLAVSAGAHSVCAYAIDSSLAGPNPQLGCRTVAVGAPAANRAPFGNLDTVTATASTISVAGWALDPDTTSPIQVHVYVDGAAVLGTIANTLRTDVGQAYGKGDNHGYTATMAAAAGAHTVCAYAIDASLTGPNPQIACRAVTVTNRAPIGYVDMVTGGTGTVQVAGWALDPDTTSPIQVHVYLDGRPVAGVLADAARSDVGRAFGMGDAHGYVAGLNAGAGTHTVCVYAIDSTLRGANPQLGCRAVTVR